MPKSSANILDIACGNGRSTEPLVSTGLKIGGVDHDIQMIEEAERQAKLKNLDIDYKVSDAEHLQFPDSYFDIVTIGTAFHFFVNDMAMSEIKRVLKPGGLIFVYWTLTTKDIPEEDEIPGAIYRKYHWMKIPSELRSLDHIVDFFNKAGLKQVSTHRIPITFNTTIEERVGLQTTSGTYELLSEEDKKSFLNEVQSVLTQKLGSRQYFTLEEEIQVCLGFKR